MFSSVVVALSSIQTRLSSIPWAVSQRNIQSASEMFSPFPCPPETMQMASGLRSKWFFAAIRRSCKDKEGVSPSTPAPSTRTYLLSISAVPFEAARMKPSVIKIAETPRHRQIRNKIRSTFPSFGRFARSLRNRRKISQVAPSARHKSPVIWKMRLVKARKPPTASSTSIHNVPAHF